ncbi:MAG: RagB/SusD family nutrient uptake outer membrane protein [Pseudarcicella sp.]|nr:RagB/SusD family nutrient uptake outer membrane protein [Pseudarcicella sp.]MBP6409577.1 RagB/SusD family nutrient uptake outer membrane protein [Pseudarcicella sp.]
MKNLYIIAIFFTGVLAYSCDDYLDTVPDNRSELNSKSKIAELLVNAYPRANYMPFCELISDNVSVIEAAAEPTSEYSLPYYFKEVTLDIEDTPNFYWSECYAAINHANMALDAINKLGNTPDLMPYKGEALLARAYTHFMLVNIFSNFYNSRTAGSDPGIPYVKEIENVVLKKYERKTVRFVYEEIESDLKDGLKLIDDNVYKNGTKAFHFTKAAAHAFASRYYLYRSGTSNVSDLNKVVYHANMVSPIEEIGSMLRDWNGEYATKSYNELSLLYPKGSEPSNLLLAETRSVWTRYFRNQRYGLSSNLAEELYYNGSPTGGRLSYATYSSSETSFLPKFSEVFVKSSPTSDIGDVYVTIPLLTADEVALNRIEANFHLGNAKGVLDELNVFYSKRVDNYNPQTHDFTAEKNNLYYSNGNDNLTAGYIFETILDLRRKEFMHEGMRWFDLLRLVENGELVRHKFPDGREDAITTTDKRRIFQLPSDVILSGLERN